VLKKREGEEKFKKREKRSPAGHAENPNISSKGQMSLQKLEGGGELWGEKLQERREGTRKKNKKIRFFRGKRA